MAVSVYCSTPFLIGVALLFLYEIGKPLETADREDLAARRAGQAA